MLLRDNIYEAIRDAILTCEFQPGQELREQILAERFRVSRSPIRDSLLRLEREHLVTVLPRQGYRVNPILRSDVEEIFALRLLIDPACAAGAARNEDAKVRTLDGFRGYGHDTVRPQAFADYNRAFHNAVADLSGNTRLTAVAKDLVAQFDRLMRFTVLINRPLNVADLVGQHEAIIDAIQTHDADRASRLAYKHAEGAHLKVIEAIARAGETLVPTTA